MSQRKLFNVKVQSTLDKTILDALYDKCLICHRNLKDGFSSSRIKQMKELNATKYNPYKIWFNCWSSGIGIEWDNVDYIPHSLGGDGISLSLQDDIEMIYKLLDLSEEPGLETVIIQINKELNN